MVNNDKRSTVKKRKSEASDTLSQSRRKTLDSFFPRLVSTSTRTHPSLESRKKASVAALNAEQTRIFQMVVDEGENVFFTGSAGTGKSLLLRTIIAALKKKYSGKPEAVGVTASTGMAASNIGGMTVHAWGAVSPSTQNLDKLLSYVKKCKPALQRWKATQVLVIDEVSMLDGHLFQILSGIANALRKKTQRPFGGIQIVLTGDFFQLPPVTKGSDPFFAFESEAWRTCVEHTVSLSQVFRQKDTRFVQLLNEMRRGKITPDTQVILKSLSRPLEIQDSLLPTELFSMRNEVERANAVRLSALGDSHPTYTFLANDTFPGCDMPKAISSSSASRVPVKATAAIDKDRERRSKLLDALGAAGKLEVKAGAQVMLVKNIDSESGLVNGSIGIVLGLWSAEQLVGKRRKLGEFVRQVKLESDGRTPALFNVDEDKENQDLTAKSGLKPLSAIAGEAYPLVKFRLSNGSEETLLLVRDEFRVDDKDGKMVARRVQVPLVLAWAMSIHKSQGQTIQRLKIDLGRVFEKGQTYVALSRASSLDGLQVLGFNPKKVMVHPKVVAWHRQFEEAISPQVSDSHSIQPVCETTMSS